MINVLFVDDEANILDGLRRMLRPMRREWEMQFVDSGDEALKALAEKPYDVVVSDMRMPGMDGVELLTRVMEDYPKIVRLALSGHAEMEKILEAARVAHQYMAKPCNADTLIDTVKRVCGMFELFDNPELESILGRIGNLPSLPHLYIELMEEIADPNSDMSRIGEIISRDVAMSSKIMQLVNSSFFGMSQHIASPTQAASLLGLNTIKGLAITTQAFSTFDASTSGFDMEKLWRHSSKTAALAARIAAVESDEKRVADHSFIAGLLHDIGQLILATQFPDLYQQTQPLRDAGELTETEIETRVFGCSHEEVGAYLINLWGFPNPVVEALAYHHAPSKSVGDNFTPLTAVHAAETLLRHIEENGSDDEIEIDLNYLDRIQKSDRVPVWLAECRDCLMEANSRE